MIDKNEWWYEYCLRVFLARVRVWLYCHVVWSHDGAEALRFDGRVQAVVSYKRNSKKIKKVYYGETDDHYI